jgi:hypothetical protein
VRRAYRAPSERIDARLVPARSGETNAGFTKSSRAASLPHGVHFCRMIAGSIALLAAKTRRIDAVTDSNNSTYSKSLFVYIEV